jgi:hypothetical protein
MIRIQNISFRARVLELIGRDAPLPLVCERLIRLIRVHNPLCEPAIGIRSEEVASAALRFSAGAVQRITAEAFGTIAQVDSTHIVKIRPIGSPKAAISFVRKGGRPPEFPDFESGDQHDGIQSFPLT